MLGIVSKLLQAATDTANAVSAQWAVARRDRQIPPNTIGRNVPLVEQC